MSDRPGRSRRDRSGNPAVRSGARPPAPSSPSAAESRADRIRAARRWASREDRRRSTLVVAGVAIAVVVAFVLVVGLRIVGEAYEPVRTESAIYTQKVAVVGVIDRTGPTEADLAVLDGQDTQVGAVLTGGGCAASGWATISAARPVTVACTPEVTDLGVVTDWRDREAEAARTGATLGALADAGANCVTAVGPAAALGAAHGDGTNADYRSVDDFVASDYADYCPVTLIDAGDRSDEIITALAARDDWTVIVAGVGGSADAQLIYRTRTTFPGWLGSASTDRQGVVTLADLGQTLQGLVAGTPPVAGPVGNPLQVEETGGITPDRLTQHLDRLERLITPPVGPMIVLGAVVVLASAGAAVAWRTGRRAAATWLGFGTATLPLALVAAGVVGWWRTSNPDATLVLSVLVCWAGLTAGIRALNARLTTRGDDPARTAGLVIAVPTLLGLVVDAALGGPAERSSLLALRPMRTFTGVDGPGWALLIGAGVVVAGLLLISWRADRRALGPDDDPMTPAALLIRPVLAVAALALTATAAVWTVPDAADGPARHWLGGVVVVAWIVGSAWLLRRSVAADRAAGVG